MLATETKPITDQERAITSMQIALDWMRDHNCALCTHGACFDVITMRPRLQFQNLKDLKRVLAGTGARATVVKGSESDTWTVLHDGIEFVCYDWRIGGKRDQREVTL